MKKIAIIGHGYVGQAIEKLFKNYYELVIVDPRHDTPIKRQKELANECELGIICVPTPKKENGECDISIVDETIKWLNTNFILVKSTIPPGATDYFIEKHKKNIAFSPEYVGEGKYFVSFWKYPHPTDMIYHDFQIFGGNKSVTSRIIDFFLPVMGPEKKYIQTNAKTAELVKYMENSWGATKVTFCNEFFEIAEILGVDYNELRELFLLDGRVERMHTAVFREKRGYGGKCFPKDVSGIIQVAKKAGYNPSFLEELEKSNERFNSKNP